MVLPIVKYDPISSATVLLTLLAMVVGPVLAAKSPETLPVAYCLVAMGALLSWSRVRATAFEMTMPIAGRRLFLARTGLSLAAIWLPALAGCASALSIGGATRTHAAVALLDCASAATLLFTCLQTIRTEQIQIPAWPVIASAWLVNMAASSWSVRAATGGGIAAICIGLSAVVFAWVWKRVPNSYRLAPDGPRQIVEAPPRLALSVQAVPRPSAAIAWRWMPLLRSSTPGLWVSVMLYVGAALPGGVCGCWLLTFGWVILRQRAVWLRALPVKPRTTLAAFAAQAMAALVAGYLSFGLRWVHGTHERVWMLSLILGFALAIMLAMTLVDWRPLTRANPNWRPLPAVAVVVPIFLTAGLIAFGSKNVFAAPARYLPASLPLTILICVVPLVLLAWALDRVYAQSEYADRPHVSKDGVFR